MISRRRKLHSAPVLAGLVAISLSAGVQAETWYFDYVAHIDGSDRPGAPTGTLLTGQFSYDPAAVQQFGDHHYYPFNGTASMSAMGSEGFSLTMEMRAINVTPGEQSDTMTMQSFRSESPNDWHMVFDLIEPGGNDGWLQGDSSLPDAFPDSLDNAFLSIYFTDEYDWVRVIEGTFLSISRAAGPYEPAVTRVEMDGDIATGISRLPLGDRIFDVTFRAGASHRQFGEAPRFDFRGAADAQAARDAIVAVLNQAGGVAGVGKHASASRPVFRIPFALLDGGSPDAATRDVTAIDRLLVWEGIADSGGQWIGPTSAGQFVSGEASRWARFIEVSDTDGTANMPPQADFGGPYSGIAGVPRVFDASGSHDPDGAIDSYRWDFGDNSGVQSGVSREHTFVSPGAYNVTLTVRDDDGVSASTSQVVRIGMSSVPPMADAGGPYSGSVGVAVSFDGRMSGDVDSAIDRYRWNFGDETPARNGRTRQHVYTVPGRYPVTLQVTDAGGDAGTAVTWVQIASGSRPPRADAGGPYMSVAGEVVSFDGSGSDAAADAVYEWDFGDGSGTVAGRKPDHVYSKAGTYTAVLSVASAGGATDSAVATVIVSPP